MLYPMFVHSYLEVVKQKQSMRASDMMRRHKGRFVDAAGACVSISQELADLSNVLYPQHLKTHRLAKSVRSHPSPSPPSCLRPSRDWAPVTGSPFPVSQASRRPCMGTLSFEAYHMRMCAIGLHAGRWVACWRSPRPG